jgi:hypothetical protein
VPSAFEPDWSAELAGVAGPALLLQIGPLILAHNRIWVIGKKPSEQFPNVEHRAESLELKTNFALVLRHRFRGMTVTLWQRR